MLFLARVAVYSEVRMLPCMYGEHCWILSLFPFVIWLWCVPNLSLDIGGTQLPPRHAAAGSRRPPLNVEHSADHRLHCCMVVVETRHNWQLWRQGVCSLPHRIFHFLFLGGMEKRVFWLNWALGEPFMSRHHGWRLAAFGHSLAGRHRRFEHAHASARRMTL